MSCGVGFRRGSDPKLLWLWRRLGATAPTGPLAWESPYAVGAVLEKAKRPKKRQKKISASIDVYPDDLCHSSSTGKTFWIQVQLESLVGDFKLQNHTDYSLSNSNRVQHFSHLGSCVSFLGTHSELELRGTESDGYLRKLCLISTL